MIYINDPLGNNNISYHQRKAMESSCKLYVHDIQTINSIDDVQLGSEIVFEEIDHMGQLRSLTGLAALYQMRNIRIMDNHNYTLYARSQTANKSPTVIHIDAHADLDTPLRAKDAQETRRSYTTQGTTVGSFIQPALQNNIISDCIQIRSYYTLEQLATHKWPLGTPIIIDIDLDFRAHENTIPHHHINLLYTVISSLSSTESLTAITIATSPYFLDQNKAIRFLQELKPLLQS